MTEMHKRDTKTPEPAIDPPAVEVAPKEAPADPAESGVAPEQQLDPEQQPDPEPPEPESNNNSLVHVPLLRFTEVARARLDSVEPKRFAAMASHAERRISPWVDIKIRPSDPAAIPEYIKAAPAVQQMEKTDNIMHVWCAGTGAESVHPARLQRPYKYTVALDKTSLENAIVQVTGAADKKDDTKTQEAAYKASLFASHPSVFVISDGRRPSSTKTIMSTVTKAARAAGAGMKIPFPFRLMHSNAEFSHGRNLRGAGHRPGAATVPEPLETLTIVMGTSFKVRPVARIQSEANLHCGRCS